ncbi:LysE family transporter [Acinetobacter baumannii]
MKGLLTNLSNPKAVIYFGSVFSLFLANPQLDQVHWLLFIIVSVETILWFCFVTFIFSLPSFRVAYRNFQNGLMVFPGIFTVFGIFLIGNR